MTDITDKPLTEEELDFLRAQAQNAHEPDSKFADEPHFGADEMLRALATIDHLREIYHKAAVNEGEVMDDLAVATDLLLRWVTPERDMPGDDQDRFGLHLHDETESFLGATHA